MELWLVPQLSKTTTRSDGSVGEEKTGSKLTADVRLAP